MNEKNQLYTAYAGTFDNPRLQGLSLVIALSHPQDAGGTAGSLGEILLHELDHLPLIEFDADALHDYRTRRPRITFKRDHFTSPVMPKLALYAVEDRLGKPFLLLTGTEPDLRWESVTDAIVDIALRLKVSLVLSVSGFPNSVPHTRPLPVTAYGSRKDLTQGISSHQFELMVYGNITSILDSKFADAGIGTAGFSVNVPQYLSESELPQTALLAMEHLSMAGKLSLPSDRLRDLSESVYLQINKQAQADPDIMHMINRLEEAYDANANSDSYQARPLSQRPAGAVPSRDEIGAQIEAYLARVEPGDGTLGGDHPTNKRI